ncbi:hypothetical protein AALD01_04745 [Oscillospiraceae bacterium 21-37]
MSLSKLAARCQGCPFVGTCDHKEMEEVGFLPLPEIAINDSDVDIRVGVDWAKGPDYTQEMPLSVEPDTIIFSKPYSNRQRNDIKSLMDRLADEMWLYTQLYGR